MHDHVLAITGASGVIYAVRLLDVLLAAGRNVHLTISPSGTQVLAQELGLTVDTVKFNPAQLLPNPAELPADHPLQQIPREPNTSSGSRGQIHYHHYQDFFAGIASGSFRTAGMVICPCSMGTLAAIANGLSTNLIHRAADVHLKERRKLIVVPREMPLGSIQLENMKRLSDAGAVILPAMPGFYHQPQTIAELVDFVVSRICDQLGVEVNLSRRWSE